MEFKPGVFAGSLLLQDGMNMIYNLQVKRTLQLAMKTISIGEHDWGSARAYGGKTTFYKSHAPNYDDPVEGDIIIVIKNEDMQWLGTKVD